MTGEPFDTAEALRWLRALAKNNDRTWFATHRAVYDERIKAEWHDLVAGLLIAVAASDERFAYVDPSACVFRLARDIRFSNDKTPFKTALSAWLSPHGKSGTNAGFYIHIAPGSCRFGAGIYTPEKPALEALRRRLAADARPFERIVRAKKMLPYLPIDTDPLIRMPRGFSPEHPRGDLIRARRLLVRREYADAEIARAGAFATFRSAIRDCTPFVRYIDAVIDGG
jgi:uncharacterized protein (TIGR02453 family)